MVKKQIAPSRLCRRHGAGQIGQAGWGVGRAGSAACTTSSPGRGSTPRRRRARDAHRRRRSSGGRQGVDSVVCPFSASVASPAWLPGCACWQGFCFDANFDQNPIFSRLFPWVASAHGRLCPQSCRPPTSVMVSSGPIHWVGAAWCNHASCHTRRAGGQILRVLSTHGTRSTLTGACPGLPFRVDPG